MFKVDRKGREPMASHPVADRRVTRPQAKPTPGALAAQMAMSTPPSPMPLSANRLRYFFGENPGRPLPSVVREGMEARLDENLGDVRIHDDPASAVLAKSAGAEAFTFGDHIALRDSAPVSDPSRQGLVAHELAHHVQQKNHGGSPTGDAPLRPGAPTDAAEVEAERFASAPARGEPSHGVHATPASGALARVPAPPTAAGAAVPFDRSQATITGLPVSAIATTVGSTVVLGPFIATPTVSAAGANHLSWEVYNPSDVFMAGSSTTKSEADALTRPFVINGSNLVPGSVPQGRYLVRLIARKDGVPVAYSDATSYVWTTTPIAMLNATDVNAIKNQPATNTLGQVGAASARSMMQEHQAAVATTRVGTVQGNQCSTAAPSGSSPNMQDCTTYVLDTLKGAFTAKGMATEWKTIFDEAKKLSGGAFKGTALLNALVSKGGWKAVFWSPDPRNPSDSLPEHPTANKKVNESGTYYGIPVEKSQSVINYRPTSSTKQESMIQIDKLRQVPFAVIAAKGGMHMTLLLSGVVYEVHWNLPVTDPNVIEATPLESWGWNSGVVVMPLADYQAAFP